MEPERGVEQQLEWGPGTAACLCPAAVAAAAGAPVPLVPRRALEQEMMRRADLQLAQGGGGGDRRRERLMKNRQSAERSRARRSAYVNELEKEVSLLRAEIEELRKLYKQVKEAAEAPAPVKRAAPRQLQRTSSAPV